LSVIRSDHKIHEAACAIAESNRQATIAASGSTTSGCIAADVAFYRAVISSCKANGLPFSNFTQALINLGTGGA
jgi:hypothetical protein